MAYGKRSAWRCSIPRRSPAPGWSRDKDSARKSLAFFSDDGELMAVRLGDYKMPPADKPLVAMLRDLLLPWLWIDGLIGTDFVWRGNAMSIDEDAEPALNDAR